MASHNKYYPIPQPSKKEDEKKENEKKDGDANRSES
jgi:hypothetical protein